MSECEFAGDCHECVRCLEEDLRDAIRAFACTWQAHDTHHQRAGDWVDEAITKLVARARLAGAA